MLQSDLSDIERELKILRKESFQRSKKLVAIYQQMSEPEFLKRLLDNEINGKAAAHAYYEMYNSVIKEHAAEKSKLTKEIDSLKAKIEELSKPKTEPVVIQEVLEVPPAPVKTGNMLVDNPALCFGYLFAAGFLAIIVIFALRWGGKK